MSELMEKEVYNAAVVGDVTVFSNGNEEQLLRKTSQKNNILHIATQHEQIHFIEAALDNLPKTPICESLIRAQNRHGNTPLHVAAEVGDEAVVHRLYEFFSMQCGSDKVLPWRVMNNDGNTPAHVALLYGNVSVAVYLVEKDGCLARVLNHSKETLLHLAIQYHVSETEGPTTDIWPIIELLLKIDSSVACWEDRDGATPLHRATSLKPTYCIPVIKAILASCPEAAEVHDEGSGQTILHRLTNSHVASYEQGLELLHIPQVYALRNSKNHQGDTPLHLAARNRDNIMVQALLGSNAKIGIKNKSEISAGTLVRQLEEMRFKEIPIEDRRNLTKTEREAAKEGNVAFLKETLVSLGTNFLVSRAPNGGNILHILMQHKFNDREINEVEEFIGEAIQKLPLLISQKDYNGDTPIHVLAKNAHSARLLVLSYKYFDKAQEEAGVDARARLYYPPWRLKNLTGDTPLHVAVTAGCYAAANLLVRIDDEVAGYLNNHIQTPLHLLAARNDSTSVDFYGQVHPIIRSLISYLINGNADLPYMQDKDGLTPLLTAAQNLHVHIFKELFKQFPDCSKVADYKGKTMLHLFANRRPYLTTKLSYRSYVLIDLMNEIKGDNWFGRAMTHEDNDGNTPLHLAIANQHFTLAQIFLNENQKFTWNDILEQPNNDGVSCYDLIGSTEHLPYEFEKSLFSIKGNHAFGHRSLYGVPTTKIEDYANTIGVVAALLATISFTAAFTVPGGLDSSNGTPLLLQKASFQVFMVADMTALCSSLMVLFCLLWIMTTTCKKDTILLLDVSVFLLRTSFLATLVAFMTGLYVTTIHFAPAIAICTCATCTLLIILMQKRLLMLTVVPVCSTLILWGNRLGQFGSYLWSSIKSQYRKCFKNNHSPNSNYRYRY